MFNTSTVSFSVRLSLQIGSGACESFSSFAQHIQICNEALKPFFREDERQEAKRDEEYKDERTNKCIAKWIKVL